MTVAGTSAGAQVSCRGASTASCTVGLTMSVTETLKGGRVIALSARAKTSKKAVLVGTASATLKGGQTETRPGRTQRHRQAPAQPAPRLTASSSTVTSGSSNVLTKTITFVTHPKKKRR